MGVYALSIRIPAPYSISLRQELNRHAYGITEVMLNIRCGLLPQSVAVPIFWDEKLARRTFGIIN